MAWIYCPVSCPPNVSTSLHDRKKCSWKALRELLSSFSSVAFKDTHTAFPSTCMVFWTLAESSLSASKLLATTCAYRSESTSYFPWLSFFPSNSSFPRQRPSLPFPFVLSFSSHPSTSAVRRTHVLVVGVHQSFLRHRRPIFFVFQSVIHERVFLRHLVLQWLRKHVHVRSPPTNAHETVDTGR